MQNKQHLKCIYSQKVGQTSKIMIATHWLHYREEANKNHWNKHHLDLEHCVAANIADDCSNSAAAAATTINSMNFAKWARVSFVFVS